jgi:small subunit ribosomal protein S3
MGQKVHPESMRVGYIHDWKSNWFNEKQLRGLSGRGRRHPALHHQPPRARGLSDITIRKDANEVEVNINTARPGIVIGKSGSEVDQVRRDLHRITNKQVKVNILEIKRPELDAKLVAQSIAEQLVNRVAFRRAMKRALTSAMRSGRQGLQDPGLRPPRRRRDGAHRDVLRRSRPAAHAARRHRLRLLRGAHDLRAHRREVLDQQGRDHARRLHRRRPHLARRPAPGSRDDRDDNRRDRGRGDGRGRGGPGGRGGGPGGGGRGGPGGGRGPGGPAAAAAAEAVAADPVVEAAASAAAVAVAAEAARWGFQGGPRRSRSRIYSGGISRMTVQETI